MTRYFEITIEKESIPIDLTTGEQKMYSSYSMSGVELSKPIVRFDFEIPENSGFNSEPYATSIFHRIIKRHYKKVISIKELEEIKLIE